MSKVVQLKISPNASRAARVRALLKERDNTEAEIAAILREQLDEMGEAKWLAWCEREFGWGRSASYRHLNPAQLQKDRDGERQRRETRDIGREEVENIEDEIDGEDPENYRTAFLLRAEQAIRFASYSRGTVTKEISRTARAVAKAWATLATKLEKSL